MKKSSLERGLDECIVGNDYAFFFCLFTEKITTVLSDVNKGVIIATIEQIATVNGGR